ncbi:MAG: efflux RND transporter periplasmic adaptor subunit [Hyphomicrobiaceae bacterium]
MAQLGIRSHMPGHVAGRAPAALLLGLVVWLLTVAGCDRPQADTNKGKGPPAAPPPPTVTVAKPRVEEIVEWDEYTARFEAVEQVDIRARISGYLIEVAFKDGQVVKKGDLLYVIDQRPFERALEQARAELAQAKTKTENAMLDVERGKPLMERRVMSEKVFDDRANLLRDAQASVKIAEAKVATAELDLSFARITAPIGGRISRSSQSAGNWVAAGGAANSTLLTTIVSQDPIHVYFDVSENNHLKYLRLNARGEKAGASSMGALIEVAMPDERNFAHKGVLDFVDNRLDQGTATIRARAVVDNAAQIFSPGMFARVRIAGSAKYAAVMIPDEAIGTDQASKFVLVVGEDNGVMRRPVNLGPLHNGLRVVRDGVKPDDWVVTKGVQRARPGQKVTPTRTELKVESQAAAPPAAAAPSPAPVLLPAQATPTAPASPSAPAAAPKK